MRKDNDLLRAALRGDANERRIQAWQERMEFHNWHMRKFGTRYSFPPPITKARMSKVGGRV